MNTVFETTSVSETEAVGEQLGRRLKDGDVVALIGDLGAGKTAFTRGIARALGCTATVTSPTFTIMNLYEGEHTLAHFDVYRLEPEELYNTGFFDYAFGPCVTVIEWCDRITPYLDGDYYTVKINRVSDENRFIHITR